jgi:hypothetical protein
MQRYELLMECRAGLRHAWKTVLIIKLVDGTFKLHKVCSQCKSEKFPVWNSRGVILKSPSYRYSAEYRVFLSDHNPLEARAAILNSNVRKVTAPHVRKERPPLRLVHRAQLRRRKA